MTAVHVLRVQYVDWLGVWSRWLQYKYPVYRVIFVFYGNISKQCSYCNSSFIVIKSSGDICSVLKLKFVSFFCIQSTRIWRTSCSHPESSLRVKVIARSCPVAAEKKQRLAYDTEINEPLIS